MVFPSKVHRSYFPFVYIRNHGGGQNSQFLLLATPLRNSLLDVIRINFYFRIGESGGISHQSKWQAGSPLPAVCVGLGDKTTIILTSRGNRYLKSD